MAPNDWTPRSDAYFASPLALCARRVSSAASRLLGSTSLRFALYGWQRKTVLIDDKLSLIGTVNFDNRSFRLNFEVTGVVADRKFARRVERMLKEDLANSTELKDFDLQQSSLWERMKARGSALLSPVL
ncbi:phospholipase D-like domain-containing protein [Thiolapillus sp.]|uniref:phospholipase D-like domain-containing protein n=1 Tax=Thiolapillus sp. TaxID=2017437 RepID=UPI003AF53F05